MRRSLTASRGSSPEALMLSAKSSAALKSTLAQRGLGNPKIPEEIAGIATESQFNLHAQIRVFLMQEYKSPTSSLRPYIFIYLKSYIAPNRSYSMDNDLAILNVPWHSPCSWACFNNSILPDPVIWKLLYLATDLSRPTRSYYPPLLIIAPATPAPWARCSLAAFVMASTSSLVMSPRFTLTSSHPFRIAAALFLFGISKVTLSPSLNSNFQGLRVFFSWGEVTSSYFVSAGDDFSSSLASSLASSFSLSLGGS